MKNKIDDIKDSKLKQLAKELEQKFVSSNSDFKIEIENDDIYFQVNKGNEFVFSLDIRGELCEFYFGRMNFILSNAKDRAKYLSDIYMAVSSFITGNYTIIESKFFDRVVELIIVVDNNLKIKVFRSNFLNVLKRIVPDKVSTIVKKGNPIVQL